jgi:hypothetical protein
MEGSIEHMIKKLTSLTDEKAEQNTGSSSEQLIKTHLKSELI